MKSKSVLLAVMIVVAIALPALGQEDRLGKVEFANSCSRAVQEKLQRGVAMLHSFYYSATQKAFEEVAAEDNSCAIAAWGYASILMSNPLQGVGAPPKGAQQAQDAIDKGRKMGAKTERERDCLQAVAAYYEDFAARPERARQLARGRKPMRRSRRSIRTTTRRRSSTRCISPARRRRPTRRIPRTSRRRRSSKRSSRSTRAIRASRIT